MRFKPAGLTANGWAVKAGVSRAFWNDLKRHGNPSRRTLEKLLAAADSSLAEFEALRADGPTAPADTVAGRLGQSSGRGWSASPPSVLPLAASRFAGEWGEAGSGIELIAVRQDEIIDHLPRPAGLASDLDAYAVTIVGDSMWPRFRSGRHVAVSPKAPVAIGDDVLIRLNDDGNSDTVLIRELVGRSAAEVRLRQFNPDLTFVILAEQIGSIHRVIGELF